MFLGFWEWTLVLMVPAILYAAWIDYAQHRVPNWLTASIASAGLVMQAAYFGANGLTTGLLGLALGFGVLIVPWLMHGMGAGDVKLMAAIGAWLGPWLTLVSFAVGAVLGGVAAVLMITGSGKTAHALANIQTIMTKVKRVDTAFGEFGSARSFGQTSQLLPYGVPLTFGTIGVLLTYYAGGWLS